MEEQYHRHMEELLQMDDLFHCHPGCGGPENMGRIPILISYSVAGSFRHYMGHALQTISRPSLPETNNTTAHILR